MSYKYNSFVFSDNSFRIEHTKMIYGTTPAGNFKSKPHKTIIETVSPEFYTNFVKSVSFFNGFCGGTCRAYWSYTAAGYIPARITTINPDRTEKHVDTFTFKFNMEAG